MIVKKANPPLSHPPRDYISINIFAFLLCFPVGIFGLMKSFQTLDDIKQGREAEAIRHSKSAHQLASLTMGCFGLFIFTIVCVLFATGRPG